MTIFSKLLKSNLICEITYYLFYIIYQINIKLSKYNMDNDNAQEHSFLEPVLNNIILTLNAQKLVLKYSHVLLSDRDPF